MGTHLNNCDKDCMNVIFYQVKNCVKPDPVKEIEVGLSSEESSES